MLFADFYRGKRVLVTGHTGFKGSWLSLWLSQLGAEVHGLALAPSPGPNLYRLIRDGTFRSEKMVDVRDFDPLRDAIAATQPELIFHLANQAIVQPLRRDPLAKFYTNAVGTAHLLEAVRQTILDCDIVIATSAKVYESDHPSSPHRESDALAGQDVLTMSKAAMELVAQSWNRTFFRDDPGLGRIVTTRDGSTIGGGDFAPNQLVPDCARSLTAGKSVLIRNPAARRPWQHVLESLHGYLLLGARIAGAPKDSPLISAFNFGPEPGEMHNAQELVEEFLRHWPGTWEMTSEGPAKSESPRASLSIEKASKLLDWRPVWSFAEAVKRSAQWYQEHAAGKDAAELRAFTAKQIVDFETAAHASVSS